METLTQRKQHTQKLSLTQRMGNMSQVERRAVMATAAETFSEYYRTDPEVQEWQALDAVDFYDSGK